MITDDAVRILSAGGGLRLGTRTVDDLVRMASAARSGGGTLTIVGTFPTDAFVRIAAAGKAHVTFDIISTDK